MKNKSRSVVIEGLENRLHFDASQLTEAIVASTLPAQISDQAVVHAKVTIDVTNNTATLQKYPGVVDVSTTTDSVFDPQSYSEFNLGGVHTSFKLAPGAMKPFVIPVNIKKGELQDFTYGLYAFVADDTQQYSVSGPTGTLIVAPPVVTLSETETFTKLPSTATAGQKIGATDKLLITNSGTDNSTTPLTIEVYATTDGVAADGTPLLATPLVKKITVTPKKPSPIAIKLPSLPNLADGTYSIITQVKQATGVVTTTDPTTAPTLTVSAASTGGGNSGTTAGLTASITSAKPTYTADASEPGDQHLSELAMVVQILNATGKAFGSASAKSTLDFYASTSSTLDSSAKSLGESMLPLLAGEKHSFDAAIDVGQNTSLEGGPEVDYYIFVKITSPAGESVVAAYKTPIEFYGAAT